MASAAARSSGAEVAAKAHRQGRIPVHPQHQGAFAGLRKPWAQHARNGRATGPLVLSCWADGARAVVVRAARYAARGSGRQIAAQRAAGLAPDSRHPPATVERRRVAANGQAIGPGSCRDRAAAWPGHPGGRTMACTRCSGRDCDHHPEFSGLAHWLSSELIDLPSGASAEFSFDTQAGSDVGEIEPAKVTIDSPKL